MKRLALTLRCSINIEDSLLNTKLKEKDYLRITLGEKKANAPGHSYVLEIWPKGRRYT